MKELLCATGNADKFAIGEQAFLKYGCSLKQVSVEIDEIQGEDSEVILLDKVAKAHSLVQKPVLVTDDTWVIPALNGFPGAYMKSMNHWLTANDFLKLMEDKTDRTIYLDQYLAYTDGTETKTFYKRIKGTISLEARGVTGPPVVHIVQLDGDNELTISEVFDRGIEDHVYEDDAWSQAAKWFAEKS